MPNEGWIVRRSLFTLATGSTASDIHKKHDLDEQSMPRESYWREVNRKQAWISSAHAHEDPSNYSHQDASS